MINDRNGFKASLKKTLSGFPQQSISFDRILSYQSIRQKGIKKMDTISKKVKYALFAAALTMILPALSFAADKLIVKDIAGVPKFVVTDSGEVGVGTATPSAVLDISPGNISKDVVTIRGNDTANGGNEFQMKIMGHTGGASHSQFATDLYDSRITIMASDRADQAPRVAFVGPQDSLSPAARGWALFDFGSMHYDIPTAQLQIRNYNPTHTPIIQTMMQVTDNKYVGFPKGNVGVGTVSPGERFVVTDGVSTAYSDGTGWYTASSRDMKDNIEELASTDAITTIEKMTPVTFTYKNNHEDRRIGFIAEDVPELVATKERKALNSMDITAVLTKVVQEQQKTIAELKDRLATLETEMKFKQDKAQAVTLLEQ
jgi:hypothetical protein